MNLRGRAKCGIVVQEAAFRTEFGLGFGPGDLLSWEEGDRMDGGTRAIQSKLAALPSSIVSLVEWSDSLEHSFIASSRHSRHSGLIAVQVNTSSGPSTCAHAFDDGQILWMISKLRTSPLSMNTWINLLTPYKRNNISLLLAEDHHPLWMGIRKLESFVGMFTGVTLFSKLSIIRMYRCEKEIAYHFEQMSKIWTSICSTARIEPWQLMPHDFKRLQMLAPGALASDSALLDEWLSNDTKFLVKCTKGQRKETIHALRAVQTPLSTLSTFCEDIDWIGLVIKLLRDALGMNRQPEWRRLSVRDHTKGHYFSLILLTMGHADKLDEKAVSGGPGSVKEGDFKKFRYKDLTAARSWAQDQIQRQARQFGVECDAPPPSSPAAPFLPEREPGGRSQEWKCGKPFSSIFLRLRDQVYHNASSNLKSLPLLEFYAWSQLARFFPLGNDLTPNRSLLDRRPKLTLPLNVDTSSSQAPSCGHSTGRRDSISNVSFFDGIAQGNPYRQGDAYSSSSIYASDEETLIDKVNDVIDASDSDGSTVSRATSHHSEKRAVYHGPIKYTQDKRLRPVHQASPGDKDEKGFRPHKHINRNSSSRDGSTPVNNEERPLSQVSLDGRRFVTPSRKKVPVYLPAEGPRVRIEGSNWSRNTRVFPQDDDTIRLLTKHRWEGPLTIDGMNVRASDLNKFYGQEEVVVRVNQRADQQR